MSWRAAAGLGKVAPLPVARSAAVPTSRQSEVTVAFALTPEQIQSFLALAMGFAVAGLISSGYQVVTRRPPSFRLLNDGPKPTTLAAVPFLVFAAPFII